MKTIVYYGSDGRAALGRVAHLRALNGDDTAQCILAEAFVGERIKAEEIEFMPDVPGWHKARIERAFEAQKARDKLAAEDEERRRAGLPPERRIQSEDEFRRSFTSRDTTASAQVEPQMNDHAGQGAQELESPAGSSMDPSVEPDPEVDPNLPEPASSEQPEPPVARDPLDHDGDGRKGGSLPGKKSK